MYLYVCLSPCPLKSETDWFYSAFQGSATKFGLLQGIHDYWIHLFIQQTQVLEF